MNGDGVGGRVGGGEEAPQEDRHASGQADEPREDRPESAPPEDQHASGHESAPREDQYEARHADGPLRLPPREAYRRWSGSYSLTSANPLTAAVDRAASRLLPEVRGGLVLDLGCGTGRWASRLEAAGARVIGLDLVPGMLVRRPRKLPAVAADAVAIPLASESVDGVLCVLSLSHVSEPGTVLAELDRILVRGGWAVIADVHPAGQERGWRRTFRDETGRLCEVEWTAHSVATLRNEAPRVGLAIEAHTEEKLRYEELPDRLKAEADIPAAYAVLARKR